uniref:Uncharacterized protein n=1 Tax=Papilio xuthus TaxID=66420 RepID=I4DKI9_PAPXU|nr:unknown unsecreted protein [Papilio xuthus]
MLRIFLKTLRPLISTKVRNYFIAYIGIYCSYCAVYSVIFSFAPQSACGLCEVKTRSSQAQQHKRGFDFYQ